MIIEYLAYLWLIMIIFHYNLFMRFVKMLKRGELCTWPSP